MNSMNDDLLKREQLSALADGEASHPHIQAALAYAESGEGQQAWRMYHLIGDVLRSPELAHHSQHDILPGLRERLRQEGLQRPTELAQGMLGQVAPAIEPRSVANGVPVLAPGREAANAAVFRWKMAAGVASVAAVAAIGWSVMLGGMAGAPAPQAAATLLAQASSPSGPALRPLLPYRADGLGASGHLVAAHESELPLGAQAQSSSVVAVEGPQGQSVMLRDPRLDELLAIQAQQSGAPTLQMPASFLRNANFATMPSR